MFIRGVIKAGMRTVRVGFYWSVIYQSKPEIPASTRGLAIDIGSRSTYDFFVFGLSLKYWQ
jgi:hypothetical protein